MTILPFLRNQAFEPEIIDNMSFAFERVCGLMGLTTRRDPATELVACKIVEYAQRGIRDVATLVEAAKKDFELEQSSDFGDRH
ncbi:MAG TPA: hypothetical protein VL048_00270 [Xanthobacteraceae bacterium]|jgi:hypothetical protein|nr:hypothetical protein [Xanthobacteraceae bacterium]